MERPDTSDVSAPSACEAASGPGFPPALGAVLLLALALRIPGLNESLWFDELWSTSVRLDSPFAVGATAVRDNHPPLYSVLMYVWLHVFGESEISLRMLPLLASLACIGGTYALARTLSSRTTGLIAASLVAVSPVHIWYAQEARPYALWTLLILLAVLACFKLDEGRRTRRWLIVHGIGVVGALLLHFFSVAVSVVFLILCLRRRNGIERRLFWINAVGIAAVAAFIGVKAWFGLLATASTHLRPFDELQLWMTWFEWFPTGHAVWTTSLWDLDYGVLLRFPDMLAAQTLLAALLALGAREAWRRHRTGERNSATERPHLCGSSSGSALLVLCALLAAIPILLAALTSVGFGHTFIERSLMPTLPLLYVLIAVGLGSIRTRAVRVLAGVGLVTVCGAGLIAYLRTEAGSVYKANPDWRAAAQVLLDQPDTNAAVFVASPGDVLAYYDPAFRIVLPSGAAPGRLERRARELGLARPLPAGPARFPIHRLNDFGEGFPDLADPPVQHVYLVRNEYWIDAYDDLEKHVAASGRFEFVERFRVKGLAVSKYRVAR